MELKRSQRVKRIVNSFLITSRLSGGLIPLLLIAIVFPLVILAGFGLYFIYMRGYILYLIALLALGAGIAFVLLLWLKRNAAEALVSSLDESLVDASADWGEFDNQVWLDLNNQIGLYLAQKPEWGDLKEYGLKLISLTAARYDNSGSRKELAFSAPELLAMTEEISRRYRYILKTHVPFVEKVKFSTLKMLYDNKDKAEMAKPFWNMYRLYRGFTPVGLLAEARGQILGKIYGGITNELQIKLKQALLQEVLAVAIDLYSGRFRVGDDELEQSQSSFQDRQCMAKSLDPLRVCLLGQVSSGKSSLVNALTDSMAAEVSRLPSTDDIQVHQCILDGVDAIHLVDLPGLDADTNREQQLLEQVTNSDLVIWMLKANQPARSLDVQFQSKLDEYYAKSENRSRKRAAIIGVLNQVDRLKPVSEWDPPYNLNNPSEEKAKNIIDSMKYNQDLLTLDSLVPLSISDDKAPFNLSSLKSLIDQYYENGAQAQLNRRRIESGDKFELTDQAKRVYQAGKSLFKITTAPLAGQ
jgi:predicted GTPase